MFFTDLSWVLRVSSRGICVLHESAVYQDKAGRFAGVVCSRQIV